MAELASCTIYIKGVPTETTEADVRGACSQYGNIAEVAIPEGKDFCFVEFAEEAQAQVGLRAHRTHAKCTAAHRCDEQAAMILLAPRARVCPAHTWLDLYHFLCDASLRASGFLFSWF